VSESARQSAQAQALALASQSEMISQLFVVINLSKLLKPKDKPKLWRFCNSRNKLKLKPKPLQSLNKVNISQGF
jgi:hypothetical protein